MKEIFQETKIGKLSLKNRLIRSSVWMKAATINGHITDDIISTYRELADGGTALIFTGYAYISAAEQPNPKMLGIYDDTFIDEYTKLTDMVHNKGSKIAMQIVFGGSQSHHPESNSMDILAPSAIENRSSGIMPREASKEDIQKIITQFGEAALRVKKSGFDGVQIHGAHGYFLNSFLTPYYNKRSDEYNGDIHDRARIIYQVYTEIRRQVGDDFPVMIKLNHDDFMGEDGLQIQDSIEVFKRLDEMGMDLFEVSGACESSKDGMLPAMTKIASKEKQSYFQNGAAEIAQVLKAPVVVVGGNRNTTLLQNILEETQIEYFSLARPLLCEPDLVNKWQKNREYKPKCVSCNKCWCTTPNSCVLNARKS